VCRPNRRCAFDLRSAGTPGTLRCASRTINEGGSVDGVASGLTSNTGSGRRGHGRGQHAGPTGTGSTGRGLIGGRRPSCSGVEQAGGSRPTAESVDSNRQTARECRFFPEK
jgi:hypothetical protein